MRPAPTPEPNGSWRRRGMTGWRMLELHSITKRYAVGDGEQTVLDGVDLSIGQTGLVCVLGKSGCGKTTLLNILGGLDHEFEGQLVMSGASFSDFTEAAWDRYRASFVGFVFQEAHLVDYLTVLDNVRLALAVGDGRDARGNERDGEDARLALAALERCGIADLAGRMPAQLSGGQAQRVAIARAIVKEPQVVLADEPTGSLDAAAGEQVMELLAAIAQTRLVVVVTHDREMAQRFATRIVVLEGGGIAGDCACEPQAAEGGRRQPALAPQPETGPHAVPAQQVAAAQYAAPAPLPVAGKRAQRSAKGKLDMRGLARKHCANRKGRAAITAIVAGIGMFGLVLLLALNLGVRDYLERVAVQSLLTAPVQVKQDGNASALMDAATLLEQSGVYVSDDVEDGVAVDHLALAMFYAAMENRQDCDLGAFLDAVRNDPDCKVRDYAFDAQARYEFDLNVYDVRGRQILRAGEVTLMDDIDIGHAFGSQAEQVVMDNLPAKDALARQLVMNAETGESPYEVMAGRMPDAFDEAVIIADSAGHITDYFEYASGIANLSALYDAATSVLTSSQVDVPVQADSYTFDDLLGLVYRVVPTCDNYHREGTGWVDGGSDGAYMQGVLDRACELKVVGVVKPRDGYDGGQETGTIAYTSELIPHLVKRAQESDIVKEQKANPAIDVFTGEPFDDEFSSPALKAEVERCRAIVRGLLARGDFSQAKRDYVENLTPEQVLTLYEMFGSYISADGTVNVSQSDIDMAASLSDAAFISAIEAYAPATLNARYEENLKYLGAVDVARPYEVALYAKSFDADAAIKAEIDAYNDRLAQRDADASPLAYANEGQESQMAAAAAVDAMARVLGVLVAVALAMSVVMVFSVTYVSAVERKREVSLLRALGASKSAVKALFNWENAFIGGVAGLAGSLLALAVGPLVSFAIGRMTGAPISAVAPWWAVPLAVAIGVAVAVASGLAPASRAARADAAQALK